MWTTYSTLRDADPGAETSDVLRAILQEVSTRYAVRTMAWVLSPDADGSIEFAADFTATTHERFGVALVH